MIHVTIRPYTKRGHTGWEADVTVAYPDDLPPYRKRVKTPHSTEKASHDWAMRLGGRLAAKGRPLSRVELRAKSEEEASRRRPAAPTLESFAERYLRGRVSGDGCVKSTLDLAEAEIHRHLIPLVGQLRLDAITEEHFAHLKSALKDTLERGPRCPASINRIVALLWRMLDTAREWRLIERTPAKPKRLKETLPDIEIYTEPEYERLVSASSARWQQHLTVLLAGDAGLRVAELIGLRWSDLDLKEGRMVVRQQEPTPGDVRPPKGGRTRKLKLTSRLCAALKEARHLGERVLTHEAGGKAARHHIKRWIERSEKRAGIVTSLSPHKLRHTFASRLIARGATPKEVQELLGHASLVTTLRYLHLFPGAGDRAMGLLEGTDNRRLDGDRQGGE